MTSRLAIGIDLGGTNVKAALVRGDGVILVQDTMATQPAGGPVRVVARIAELVHSLLARADVPREALAGVGAGAPGPLNLREGTILRSANLPEWENVSLRAMLAEALRVRAVLDNDANAAAFGEWWVQPEPREDLVMLTLGTGVGCGAVIDGRVLHGHFGNAAELGHMIVVPGGTPCPCGQRGCLEQYASAAAVARRVVSHIGMGEPSGLQEMVLGGRVVDSVAVVEAAGRGDSLALRIFDEACKYLAIACVNIQHSYNPRTILLSGGLAEAGAVLLDRVKGHFGEQEWRLADDYPDIRFARLGYHAGVVGAAALVWQQP